MHAHIHIYTEKMRSRAWWTRTYCNSGPPFGGVLGDGMGGALRPAADACVYIYIYMCIHIYIYISTYVCSTAHGIATLLFATSFTTNTSAMQHALRALSNVCTSLCHAYVYVCAGGYMYAHGICIDV